MEAASNVSCVYFPVDGTLRPSQHLGSQPTKIRPNRVCDLHGLERAIFVARYDKHVDESDDAGVPQPCKFCQHFTGERRLIESHNQHLNRPGHVDTRALSC